MHWLKPRDVLGFVTQRYVVLSPAPWPMELLTSTFERSSRYSRKAANLEAAVEDSITGVAQPVYVLKPALELTLPAFLLAAEQFVGEQRRLPNRQFS